MQDLNDIKKCFENQEKFLQNLNNLVASSQIKRDEAFKLMNKINNYNEEYLQNLNEKISQYHEIINQIFDYNFNQRIKEGIVSIKDHLRKYIDYHKNYNPTESYYKLYLDEETKMTEFYAGLDAFSDGKMKEGFNEEIERTKRSDIFFYDFSIVFSQKIDINKDNIVEKITKYKDSLIISSGNEKNYIHNAIKSNKFDFDENNKIFDNIEEIKEIKLIIFKYIGVENFDYKGNSKSFNSSQNIKRGTEKYDPPYGYTGIGRKVLDKYENNEWLTNKSKSSRWAIAYHPIFDEKSIRKIFKEGLKPGNSQDFSGQEDIRHPGKKIQIGIYLYPNIKTAEDKANIIYFNKKYYKFILMARVKINEISEPENVNYWILNEENVRVYRLLIKEI